MPTAQRSPSPRADRDATEATPLLVDADTEASTLVGTNGYGSSASTPTDGSTVGDAGPGATAKAAPPLDKKQLILLCYLRMTEPMAFFCIFPFIAQMVQRNGKLPDSDIGFYSGLIESLFSATQMFVLVGWGRLADTIGRRPVLLCSLAGSTLGSFLFGFSSTLWQMILFRCIAGVFSGSGLIIRTVIAEISTPDTQALAFGWFAFAGNVGIFLGPLIGGVLAEPAEQYPGLFGNWTFFIDYPYALPGIVTSAINVSGLALGIFYLRETLKKQKGSDDGATEAQTATATSEPVPSTWELFKVPGVGMVLWATGHVMILAFAFTALLPVVLFEPVELGGAGFTTSQISIFMAVQGASQAAWMLLAFPKLQHKLGTKGVLKLCGNVYPFCFLAYIGLNLILRNGSPTAMVWFWTIGPLVMVIMPGVAMAFIAVQLALNDVSPSPQTLGTLNALALTLTSAIRSIVPGATTAIYAIGLRHNLFGGHLAWVILTPLAAAFGIGCRYLPEKPAVKNDDDEQDS